MRIKQIKTTNQPGEEVFSWFIRLGIGWLMFLLVCQGCQKPTQPKPNILFIITDDLNDAAGLLGGHPQSLTPNIDRLARQGVNFTRAYTNSPLCAPSRASFLSGIYPHRSGYTGAKLEPGKGRNHWQNNPTLSQSKTMMQYFDEQGYAVYGTGKVFHNDHEDYDVWQPGRFGVLPSWGPWPWDGQKPGQEWGAASSHPGYSHGLGIDGNFASLAEVPDVPPNPETGAPGYKGWRLYGKPFHYKDDNDRDLLPDELNAQWAKAKLAEVVGPFMMVVGFNRPHVPMYAPKKYFDRFPLDSIRLAPVLAADTEDTPFTPNSAPGLMGGKAGFKKYAKAKAIDGDRMLKKWTQAYLANVAFVDEMVGEVIDALLQSPHADNTLIVFTSDHGYHMGEKEYLHKNSLWEESCRVPLVIAGPGVMHGARCGEPVSLLDLYPTMTDYAGIAPSPNGPAGKNLDGYSLRPLLESNHHDAWAGPDFALSTVGTNKPRAPHEPAHPKDLNFSLRTKRFRYTRYRDGQQELYDHQNDPQEHVNQAANPKYAEDLVRLQQLLANETGM